MIVRVFSLLGFLAVLVEPALISAQTCVGDCNGDGQVTVDEIVTGVNIALGTSAIGNCLALDADSSGSATVDELVTAVNNALNGCPSACDLTGQWEFTVTKLDPPGTPDVTQLELIQDELGHVEIVEVPIFQGQVEGSILQVTACDCGDPEGLFCTEGELAIASGCNSFSGILDFVEYGTQDACTQRDETMIIDIGREQVEAVREVPPE